MTDPKVVKDDAEAVAVSSAEEFALIENIVSQFIATPGPNETWERTPAQITAARYIAKGAFAAIQTLNARRDAEVVAWLRTEAARHGSDDDSGEAWALYHAADSIERGDHLKRSEPSASSASCDLCRDPFDASVSEFPVYGVGPHECYWRKGPEFTLGQSTLISITPHDCFVPELDEGETWADYRYPAACGVYYCPNCQRDQYEAAWGRLVARIGPPPAEIMPACSHDHAQGTSALTSSV